MIEFAAGREGADAEEKIPTQGEIAFTQVRDRIMSGVYGPGTKLSEQAIADELQLSRTPVREALRRLSETGLIEHRPNQRVTVVGWSPELLRDNFDTRVLLEAEGARAAASKITSYQLLELKELMEAMEEVLRTSQPGVVDGMADLNQEFHARIMQASGREHIIRLTANLRFQPRLVSGRGHLAEAFRHHANHQHRDIHRALEAGDSQWAEAAMRAHVLAARHASLSQFDPKSGEGTDW